MNSIDNAGPAGTRVLNRADPRYDDPRWLVPLSELIVERVAASPDQIMAQDESGRTLTFREFGARSAQLADELAARGVGATSRVAWQLPTWIETLVLTGALARLGAVQIPLPYLYRTHEVRSGLQETAADLLITPTSWHGYDFSAMAGEVAANLPSLACATVDRGQLDRPEWFGALPDVVGPTDRGSFGLDVKWVFFTSGTAGAPKGVLHTDRSVTIPATTMADAFHLAAVDRAAIAFPLGHIGGVNWLIACLQSGCRLLLAERLDDASIDAFDEQGVTLAGVSTAFHLAYRNRARADPSRALFPLVRAYPGGAATKPPTLHTELRTEIGGVGIVSGYGLTECPMISMSRVTDPDDKLSSTEGPLGPGVVAELRDTATGEVLPPGVPGEVCVRAPQLFQGYIRAQDTREVVDDRGFFRTGDIGYLDADGYIVISGRLKDVIIRKGENISAKEVEDHIFAHAHVSDVAVVGLPDPDVGERCCAVIVARPGTVVPGVAELGRYLRERGLMTQKWPEQIFEVSALPRNAAGKVLKHELIRRLSIESAEPRGATPAVTSVPSEKR